MRCKYYAHAPQCCLVRASPVPYVNDEHCLRRFAIRLSPYIRMGKFQIIFTLCSTVQTFVYFVASQFKFHVSGSRVTPGSHTCYSFLPRISIHLHWPTFSFLQPALSKYENITTKSVTLPVTKCYGVRACGSYMNYTSQRKISDIRLHSTTTSHTPAIRLANIVFTRYCTTSSVRHFLILTVK
jgi:hypothetical protein